MQTPRFHLSLVATSRNDNHGGSLTRRMQHFVDGFVAQCRKHNLSAELILVEWNPPADRPPLAEALRWPEDSGSCEIRIITVPREIHDQLEHADKLPLFQMIAKNVGIRRARGKFVLATNVDILFSDESVKFMRDRLRPGRLYRVDRCDIPAELPENVSFEEIIRFCERTAFRIHANGFTCLREGQSWTPMTLMKAHMDPRLRYLLFWAPGRAFTRSWQISLSAIHKVRFCLGLRLDPITIARDFWRILASNRSLRDGLSKDGMLRGVGGSLSRIAAKLMGFLGRAWREFRRRIIDPWPHTNACGDFTLLSREDWFMLRGYPEWRLFSWHLDSVLIYQANRSGLVEEHLGKNARIFHIEHGTGSGYTPEGAQTMFSRLEAREIPYLRFTEFLDLISEMDRLREGRKWIVYNSEDWGFASVTLPEQSVGDQSKGGRLLSIT